jgi:hypothetical protein
MSDFDYAAAADLFPNSRTKTRRKVLKFRRFDQASEAVRYAIEELPPELLMGSFLQVDDDRFDGRDIRNLYDSPNYPFRRGKAA